MPFSDLHRILMAEEEEDQTLSPFASPRQAASFRPSIAVIVGVLTTVFSLTFLLLLYAKHCKRQGNNYPNGGGGGGSGGLPSPAENRNSGVARTVVESLPAFRFGALTGEKEGLECAVCLNRFEPAEVLRLLPKCKHGFHVECVDVWLEAHSTCPLCRVRVHPEDVLLLCDRNPEHVDLDPQHEPEKPAAVRLPRRISGRHSSAGEKSSRNSTLLQVVVQSDHGGNVTSERRKDSLLLTENTAEREEFERRYSHRIIVSGKKQPQQQRWSDLRPSDLLFLRSDLLLQQRSNCRSTNSLRSVSEITGMSRSLGTTRTALRLGNGAST